jgi:hypothetical protein
MVFSGEASAAMPANNELPIEVYCAPSRIHSEFIAVCSHRWL